MKHVKELPKTAKLCAEGTIGTAYEIYNSGRGNNTRYWLVFGGFRYEILRICLKTIVTPNMEHGVVRKVAKKVIAKKGKKFAWAFAERISRIISKYSLDNLWRKCLTALANDIKTLCRNT